MSVDPKIPEQSACVGELQDAVMELFICNLLDLCLISGHVNVLRNVLEEEKEGREGGRERKGRRERMMEEERKEEEKGG